MRRPRWSNEDAVFKLVVRRMREIRHEIEYHLANERLYLPTRAHELVNWHMMAEAHRWSRDSERVPAEGFLKEWAVIEAANRGDLELLIFEVRKSEFLSAPIRSLVIEFLRGRRNLKTGRLPGEEQRGRPRKSVDERRGPIHDAAELVPIIAEVLRGMYRKQTGIRERAIVFAAKIKRVDPNTLRNYFKLPESHPRRIDRRPK